MSKWNRLLDVYDGIESDPVWDHLREPGIRLVRGDGPETAETARVMVVGEAPGARENGEGKPFVGRSGVVLEGLLGLAGFQRSNVFVTNVVKYRPPGNRTPHPGEIYLGQKALRREWSIIRPLLTICVGATAHGAMHPAGHVMSMSASMNSGAAWEYRNAPGHWCISEFHPAYGLRNKKMQPFMERHWEALGAWLKEWLPEVLDER
jgi:uracil-DNA glycosylase family 4